MTQPLPAILILAAGSSSRMRGADKLMQEVAGGPLIATLAARAAATGAPVFVALPGLAHPRAQALATTPVTLVPVPDAAEGMAASLRAGLLALPDETPAVLVTPGDMPELTQADFATLLAAHAAAPGETARGASGERPGHPVLFPRALFPDLLRLTGDQGGRAVLKAHPPRLIPLPGAHALTDLDTPEAWADWRAAGGA
ncbi:NTP transferase domain-containing protein [Pseudooceanicola nanhaiensis]|uniref:nucleotidyltransferase family protein n=1 Tax=Pseudooceanicola nanhaiensis TaxID=375761 RepID=UPI001CD51D57|nr:nucleotidyltransferase family protein [Pseudooceanicola nanhaiensis]MCA0919957.1 nucleotidyltransferase family protein [Pseudooceanicola nanhaiensis]